MGEFLFIDGFDHYSDVTKIVDGRIWTWGSIGMSLVAGRSGGKAIEVAVGDENLYRTLLEPSPSSLIVGFAWKRSTQGYSSVQGLIRVGDIKVCWADGRSLYLKYGFNSPIVGSWSAPPNLLVDYDWHYVEVYVLFHQTAGRVVVRVDGAVWIDLENTQTLSATRTYQSIELLAPSFFDDIYVVTDADPDVDFQGPSRVCSLAPVGDTAAKGFTPLTGPDNYQDVDDVLGTPTSVDEDATYVASSVVGVRDLYSFSAVPVGLGSVKVVEVLTRARKDDDTSRRLRNVILSASQEGLGTSFPLGQGYGTLWDVWALDPATGLAWTPEALAALEAGFEVSA